MYTWDGYNAGNWPGTKMSTTLINGETWFYYTMPKSVTSFNMIINQGDDTHKSNDYTSVNSTRYLQYHGHNNNLTIVNGMSDYPIEAWYGQGEICAFFVNDGWDAEKAISAYVFKGDDKYAGNWPGTNCNYLGFNEDGYKIWKWNYGGASLPEGTKIIFTNKGSGGTNQLADCNFVNGAWYNTSNIDTNTSPISTAVAPSTEISVAALGDPKTVTNWDGKSEKVAQKEGSATMSKTFSLAAGSYTVQAIVRGTNGSTVTLSAKDQSDEVNLTGLDGATSTVQTSGIVETYATGTNNGWLKAEVSFTLASAEVVTVEISSEATTWQLGTLKVLPSTTKTKATTGVGLDNTYIDVRGGVADFSFFERGENRNALIKAAPNTLPTQLPYNVIVDGVCAKLQLTDGDYSFNNSGDAFTASIISYDRTFEQSPSTTRDSSEPQYKTSTVWLPFGLSADEAAEAGTFWGLQSYNNSDKKICFIKVDEPQANVPYLFEPAKANPFSSFTNKMVQQTPASITVSRDDISFIGANTRTHLKSDDGVTYYGYKNGEFVMVGTENGANVNPFRAYLQILGSQAARINVSFDGESSGETGIKVVNPDVKPMKEQPVYNMSGQRVKTPAQKGIYIVGGKKFIVK